METEYNLSVSKKSTTILSRLVFSTLQQTLLCGMENVFNYYIHQG